MQRARLMARRERRSKGISLIYSLLALVAISLSAVALVRSVSGGGLVIGNLAFKQDATAAASIAAESAAAWLNANNASLNTDVPTRGYYASSRDALDVTGNQVSTSGRTVVDWDNDNCGTYASGSFAGCVDPSPADIAVGNGNTARYVILRQCSAEGNPNTAAIDCTMPVSGSASQEMTKASLDYNRSARLTGPAVRQQYYRVVVRARGARNTVAFTETLIQY